MIPLDGIVGRVGCVDQDCKTEIDGRRDVLFFFLSHTAEPYTVSPLYADIYVDNTAPFYCAL